MVPSSCKKSRSVRSPFSQRPGASIANPWGRLEPIAAPLQLRRCLSQLLGTKTPGGALGAAGGHRFDGLSGLVRPWTTSGVGPVRFAGVGKIGGCLGTDLVA